MVSHVVGGGFDLLHELLQTMFDTEFHFMWSPDASHFELWTVFQASAALARKKGKKGLPEETSIFWHKKKISEFSDILCSI